MVNELQQFSLMVATYTELGEEWYQLCYACGTLIAQHRNEDYFYHAVVEETLSGLLKRIDKMFQVNDKVFVNEPWDGVNIPYVGYVVEIHEDILRIEIDFSSPLTSHIIHNIAEYTGYDTNYWPVHTKYCSLWR